MPGSSSKRWRSSEPIAGRPSGRHRWHAYRFCQQIGHASKAVYDAAVVPSPAGSPKLGLSAPALALIVLWSSPASSQEPESAAIDASLDASAEGAASADVSGGGDLVERSPKRGFAALNRPAGIAEFGVGWLTLPAAEVCSEPDQCERGDTTPQVDAWQLFRLNVDFAVGAGITLGLLPTRDSPTVDPPGVERSHTRQYFMFETMARYYPYVGETSEAWVGLATGLTVVKDSYVTDTNENYATVGTPGVTVQSEGFTVGFGVGAAFALAPSWSLGGALRFGSWFLPDEAKRGPFDNDDPEAIGRTRATLTGRNSVVSIGLNIAYRSSL